MNLLALAERWEEALTTKTVGFAADRCLYTVDKFATCTACYDICPAAAIQPGDPPIFVRENCQQCRACLPICPVGAFTADDEAQALLTYAEHAGAKTYEVVCALNPQVDVGTSTTAVRVRGCLAGLGVGSYLALVGQGMEQVIVRLDACANCPWSELQPQVEVQVQQAQALLALWGYEAAVTCLYEAGDDFQKRPFRHASSPPVSRRNLFSWREAEKKAAEPDAPPSLFHDRLRFLTAIKHLPAPSNPEATTSLAGLGFALMAVNDECTACGICARVCPTEALQMQTDKSSYQLVFSPQICIACDMCCHVCTPQAITLTPDPSFAQVFASPIEQVMQQGQLTHCAKCNTPFAATPDTRLCPVCEFRRQNPFGSTLPLAMMMNHTKKNLTGARSRAL